LLSKPSHSFAKVGELGHFTAMENGLDVWIDCVSFFHPPSCDRIPRKDVLDKYWGTSSKVNIVLGRGKFHCTLQLLTEGLSKAFDDISHPEN
jgi:hypothetical protein